MFRSRVNNIVFVSIFNERNEIGRCVQTQLTRNVIFVTSKVNFYVIPTLKFPLLTQTKSKAIIKELKLENPTVHLGRLISANLPKIWFNFKKEDSRQFIWPLHHKSKNIIYGIIFFKNSQH